MNEWLLRNFEGSPESRFYEWELRMYCRDFEEVLGDGLLVRDLKAEESEFCFNKWGQHLHLVRLNGVIFGADTENPDGPITEVDPKELIQYRFNLGRWQDIIRTANGLQGAVSWLHKRILFLGEKVDGGLNLGFVLGCFSRADTALDLLLSLPVRMPSKYDATIATTPIFSPLPQPEIANLERLGIYVAPPLNPETLTINYRRPSLRERGTPGVTFSKEREEEFQRYGYKSKLPIVITGDRGKWLTNAVMINGFSVTLGDTLFMIFLRLVVQLLRSRNGLSKAGLRSAGYLKSGSEEQTIGHLRKALGKALGDLDPRAFIESCNRGSIRLSTHPALVKYDKDKLLRHRNEEIRRLAVQLP